MFQQLIVEPSRIKKAIIGTHFYQTHPDVLDTFVGSKNVRFMLQPNGVFHPKVYLFWNHNTWEALVGSANLTEGAFSVNSEVVMLISGSDESASLIREQITSTIEQYWQQANPVDNATAEKYRRLWLLKQPALRHLSGQYGKTKSRKPPTASSVYSMSWLQFLDSIRQDVFHEFDERCNLLKSVRTAFNDYGEFALMDTGLRQTIAGLPNTYDKNWGWFGSMKGAGYFRQAVNDNNCHLSSALDKVPSQGFVSRFQYQEYLEEFIKAFPKGRHGIATASRLLALKRPDQFVCVDSKNLRELCKNFGIPQTGMNYERYWDEVVERIIESPWWNAPRPNTGKDGDAWDGRAALLDAVFYRP
jgi:hypothetical protein